MACTVRHGVNTTTLDSLAGKTVAEVREQVAELMNVPDSAEVRINGSPADEDTVIGENSTVEFVKVAGEKGVFARS